MFTMKFNRRLIFLCSVISSAVLLFLIWLYCYSGRKEVTGWEEHVSRDAKDYIHEGLMPLLLPSQFCVQNKVLLVIVTSRPDAFSRRQTIRETWGYKNKRVDIYFLLGQPPGGGNEIQKAIDEESARYDDIIQERFIDVYANLTLKSVHMLKLFTKACTKTRFLMKADDDVFVNVPFTLSTLLKLQPNESILVGKKHDARAPIRNYFNKWYMPLSMYPDTVYPDFLCGSGYVMSADVARLLYQCSLQEDLLYLEDLYITGVCGRKTGAPLVHSSDFHCQKEESSASCEKRSLNFSTYHYFSEEDMRQFYVKLVFGRCEKTYFERFQDWIF